MRRPSLLRQLCPFQGKSHGVLATVVDPNLIVVLDGLAHDLDQVRAQEEPDVLDGEGDLAHFQGPVAQFGGPQGRVGLMVPHAADHELGDGVEGQLARLARQDVGHVAQDVGGGHCGEVILVGKLTTEGKKRKSM